MTTLTRSKHGSNGMAVHREAPAAGRPPKPGFLPQWEYVTPDIASKYFATNAGNRILRPWWVAVLADQMRRGVYCPTHQGIAIDENNVLRDGQHRCKAIIESGTSQWMLVTKGLPVSAIVGLDRGCKRSNIDNLRITMGRAITKTDESIARAMVDGVSNSGNAPSRKLEGQALAEFLEEYEDPIRFAAHHGGVKNFPSIVRGMIAKAWLHVDDRDRLAEFRDIIAGARTPEGAKDSAANRLQRLLWDPNKLQRQTARQSIAAKTLNAIDCFMASKPIENLKERSQDPYPLIRLA